MTTLEHALSILNALKDGKEVEFDTHDGEGWTTLLPDHEEYAFNFADLEYRLKEEPKMSSDAVNLAFVPLGKLEDGNYYGSWTGHYVTVRYNGLRVQLGTEEGIRGTTECLVVVSNGEVKVHEISKESE